MFSSSMRSEPTTLKGSKFILSLPSMLREVHWLLPILSHIIKIMPCVEGDRSDCQPEANSIARSRRLRAVVVVKG